MNKVLLVTGGSRGIGAAIAKTLAARGAAVVVNYASSKAGADAYAFVIESVTGDPGTFDVVLCDNVVDHAKDPRRILEEIARVTRPGYEPVFPKWWQFWK